MSPDRTLKNYNDSIYCCHIKSDSLADEHMLVRICSGEMILVTPIGNVSFKAGDTVFIKRNHLVKRIQQSSPDGEGFGGHFLYFKIPFLQRMLSERSINITTFKNENADRSNHTLLEKHPLLDSLFVAFEQYFDSEQSPSDILIETKLKEAIHILLQLNPKVGSTLFNFIDPWKNDLESFMLTHYKCDLSVNEFAHYTGRSLSTFKKEFVRIFNETPSRWLIKKRLEEAMTLINKGFKPSDTYLEVGFKNLSHFSTAFKREYGISPTMLPSIANKTF